MKKLFLLLPALLVCLQVAAQTEESIVVSRYIDDRTEIPQTEKQEVEPYKKVWFSVEGGFSYRVAKAAPGAADFVDKMRPGYVLGADMHFALSPMSLLGARFSTHRYAHSEYGVSDKVNTYYIGPSYMYRSLTLNGAGAWIFGVSLGYLSFSEELSNGINNISYSKGGFGTTVDIGYDFLIRDNICLGLKFSLFSGNVNTDLIDENGKRLRESLNAIDIGLALRF